VTADNLAAVDDEAIEDAPPATFEGFAQAERERVMLPPKERPRINPKLGLASMVYFVMDLRHRGKALNGDDSRAAWVSLTPSDLEKLEDVAETLEWFRLQRLQAKWKSDRR
jgi:hypothetical protein